MQRLTRILVIGKRMAMFRWGPRRQCCSWPAGWAATAQAVGVDKRHLRKIDVADGR
jgi:hypothetical protein